MMMIQYFFTEELFNRLVGQLSFSKSNNHLIYIFLGKNTLLLNILNYCRDEHQNAKLLTTLLAFL